MRMSFLGAAHMVTGSCYLVETEDRKFLVDCGMFQGARRIRELNYEAFPFSPAELDCVVLTHAHVDHCGLLPKLCREGFKGSIYATKVTCDLAGIMLPDSAYIQQSDAELMNRKGRRRGDAPIEALYSLEDAQEALSHLVPVSYDETVAILPNVQVIFRDAGHIIGSALLEIQVEEGGKVTRLAFSGDLGQPDQPILRNPTLLQGADFLVMESTYGDRLHKLYDRETALLEVINDTMDRGGNLVIPAFAVGRTQTLLYYFYKLWKAGRLDGDIPIILDSPLAIAATRVFLQNMHVFDEESIQLLEHGAKVLNFPQLHICETAAESRTLNSEEGSAIILSASGMADAGRILHHLKHNLWRPESTILFVGYQAEGSMGRRLIDGVKRVRILGEEVVVRAKIQSMDGFSAHADAHQIVDWVSHLENPRPAKIFIVHGEAQAQEALKEQFDRKLGMESYIPFRGDSVKIHGRASEIVKSNISQVSVEMEMEDVLKDFDAEYRQLRRKLVHIVVRQPKLMEPIVKGLTKARNYIKKLFASYNV